MQDEIGPNESFLKVIVIIYLAFQIIAMSNKNMSHIPYFGMKYQKAILKYDIRNLLQYSEASYYWLHFL